MRKLGLREVLVFPREHLSEVDLNLAQPAVPAQGNALSLTFSSKKVTLKFGTIPTLYPSVTLNDILEAVVLLPQTFSPRGVTVTS